MGKRLAGAAFALCAAILVTAAAGSNGGDWKAARGLPGAASWEQAVKVRAAVEVGDRIELEYAMPALTVREITDPVKRDLLCVGADEAVVSVSMGNAFVIGDVGNPMLPLVPAKILLPAGYEVDRIDVTAAGKVELDGKFLVEQRLQPVHRDQGIGGLIPTPRNPEVYGSDNPHPGKLYDVVGVQKKRGMSILYVNLFPVQYRGKSGKITYYTDFDVKVSLKPAAEPAEADGVRVRRDPVSPVEGEVDNPKAAATYHPEMSFVAPLALPAGNYQYVIVTNDELRNALISPNLNDLLKHKKSRGYTATIVTMEYIKANYTGTDDAAKLRAFILDAYNTWSTDYVLLFGDVRVVPYRLLMNADDGGIPGDIYMGCLDGSWNENHNQYYGENTDGPRRTEVDLTYEVYVGRAAADTPVEMSNYVYKLMAYDTQAYANQFRRLLLLGDKLDVGWFGSVECEYMRLGIGPPAQPTQTVGFVNAPVTLTIDQQYETDGPPSYYYDWPEVLGWINSNNYGLIGHSGHGDCNWELKITGVQVTENLTNTQYFFVATEGCYPGDFEVGCWAEAVTVVNRDKAAVGAVLNSRYGWGGVNSILEMWDQANAHGYRNFGAINAKGDEALTSVIYGDFYWRYAVFETNLFCDPETRLRGWETARTISASAGTGGWIYPTGTVNAEQAENRTFTITPDSGYAISNVTVDGSPQGAISSYTFTNLTANHTISATFTSTATRYTLSGSVKTSAGAGIPDATVCFKTSPNASVDPLYTVTTDASGNYSKALVNGTWYVVAWKWGYLLPTEQMVTVNGANVSNINFTLTVPSPIPTPVIKLDTSALKVGTLRTWSNTGSLGGSFGYDGTTPTVGTVGGKKAVSFDYGDRMKSSFTAPAAITGTHEYTIAIWAYNPTVEDYEYLISLANYNGYDGTTTTLCFASSTTWGATDHYNLYMGFDGGVPSANAWHHICSTFDGTVEKVYVDGVLNAQRIRNIDCRTGLPVFLGCCYWNTGGANDTKDYYYSGSMGAIRVYDRALRQDEVVTIYNQSW